MALYSAAQKTIDLVITTYNRLSLTKDTIESILERTHYPYNLHVVDNASTDGTVEYLLQLKKDGKIKRLVLNDYNTGMIMPKAQSMSLCSSPIFIISDCDVLPPDVYDINGKCWLEQSISMMNTDPKLLMMSLAVGKAKAKPWAQSNGISYCRFMGQTFQFFRQEAFESIKGNPPILAFERKCDDDEKKPVFAPIDTRTCNTVTGSGYRVGYTTNLWADHIGSGITKNGIPYWGYGTRNAVPMERRIFNEEEYKRHAYVECDSKTNKPISEAILNRYHTVNPIAVFAPPFNPKVLDGFLLVCSHYPNGIAWDSLYYGNSSNELFTTKCNYIKLITEGKIHECDGHFTIIKK